MYEHYPMTRKILALAVAALVAACAAPPTYNATDQRWADEQADRTRQLALTQSPDEKMSAYFAARQIIPQVPANLRMQAAAYIKETLKDPESARFRFDFMSVGNGVQAVCGNVNSRNSFGGYVGNQPFFYATDGRLQTGGVFSRENATVGIMVCGHTDLDGRWVLSLTMSGTL